MPGNSTFAALLVRDLKIACRHRAEAILPLIFFVIVASLFPLAVSPDPEVLKKIGPGVIWVAGLLSVLLSLQSLFRTDFQDGSIEQMLLSPYPTTLLITARLIAQWCVTGLPLIVVAPLLGFLLHLDSQVIKVLFISLLLGVPYLNMVGTIGVALTVGIRQAGALLSLLVLPLYVPALTLRQSRRHCGGQPTALPGTTALVGRVTGAGHHTESVCNRFRPQAILWLSVNERYNLYSLNENIKLMSIKEPLWLVFHRMASPHFFYTLSGRLLPYCALLTALLLTVGLVGGPGLRAGRL